MKWVVLGAVSVLVFVLCLGTTTKAQEGQFEGWGNQNVSVIARGEGEHPVSDTYPCGGSETTITIQGYLNSTGACVFGSFQSLRFARYLNTNGIFEYAVAQSLSNEFKVVGGLCAGMPQCLYNEKSDTLLLQAYTSTLQRSYRICREFTAHLQFDLATNRYHWLGIEDSCNQALTIQGRVLPAGGAAFSSNGQWVVIELHDYGLIRINVLSGETKRVYAPGARYGLSNDPTYELAVSDNGAFIAATGLRVGFFVLEVSEGCGDALIDSTVREYAPIITSCPRAFLQPSTLFSLFLHGHQPRFIEDGRALSAVVVRNTKVESVVMTPQVLEPDSGRLYTALGDSFSSGEGEIDRSYYLGEPTDSTYKCHVSRRSYPYEAGVKWGLLVKNHACSGARAQDVLHANGQRTAQINSIVDDRPRVVSIGIGGNDVGLIDKLKSCLNLNTCEWASGQISRKAIADEMDRFAAPLEAVIKEVRARAPQAVILVVGYPKIVNDSEFARCSVLTGALLNGEERIFINESIAYLNGVLQMVAQSEGVLFGNTAHALEGGRLCDETEQSMNGVRFGLDIAPIQQLPFLKVIASESFHPTPHGHTQIAERLTQQYSTIILATPCTPQCPGVTQNTAYWQLSQNTEDGIRYSAYQSIKSTTEDTVQVNVDNDVLRAYAPVRVELHSSPVVLYEGITAERGVFQQNLALPQTLETGFHTLHIISEDQAYQKVDLYQTIWIDGANEPQPLHFATRVDSQESSASQVAALGNDSHEKNFKVLGATVVDNNQSSPQNAQWMPTRTRQLDVSAMITIVIIVGFSCISSYLLIKRRNKP